MKLPPFRIASLIVASLLLPSCVGSFATVNATASAAPSTSDGEPSPQNDFYMDVQSKSQLSGIPYYFETSVKIAVATYFKYSGGFLTKPAGTHGVGRYSIIDNRLAFTGLKQTGSGWIRVIREFHGDVEYTATVAVKPGSQGDVTGYIQLNFPSLGKGEQPANHVYLGASTSGFGLFSMQGWDSASPVGNPVNINNTDQVDLRLSRTGGNVHMSARRAAYIFGDNEPWVPVVTVPDPMPGTPCSIEFGGEGIDPGEEVFFDFFYVGGPTIGGVAETASLNLIDEATSNVDDAIDAMELINPDFGAAVSHLNLALVRLADAATSIETTQGGGEFQANTQAGLARKTVERARKAVQKSRDLCLKEDVKKKATILKNLNTARDLCVVAMANLAGVKATSIKKVPLK